MANVTILYLKDADEILFSTTIKGEGVFYSARKARLWVIAEVVYMRRDANN